MARRISKALSFTLLCAGLVGLVTSIGGAAESADHLEAPPEWAGTWEVVRVSPEEEAPPEGFRSFFRISRDSVISIQKKKDGPCKARRMAVLCTDGSLVSTKAGQQKLYQFRFSVSGDTLTAMPVNTDDNVEIMAVSSDVDPMQSLDCTGGSSSK